MPSLAKRNAVIAEMKVLLVKRSKQQRTRSVRFVGRFIDREGFFSRSFVTCFEGQNGIIFRSMEKGALWLFSPNTLSGYGGHGAAAT